MTTVVDVASASGYTLVITDDDELEARRSLEGDRIRRYTTAERDHTIDRQTQGEYALSIDAVIDRYAAHANPSQSRFRLATAKTYKCQLDTQANRDTTSSRRDADPENNTGAPTERHHSSNLDMNERQRRVLSRFTTDTFSTGTDEAGHNVGPILAGVHTILIGIDSDHLTDDDADKLETARDAIQSIM